MDKEKRRESRAWVVLEKKIKQVKILLFILVGIFILGSLGFFLYDKTLGILNSFLRTAEALIFIHHYNEGFGKMLSLFISLFGVITVWWAVWSLFDFLLEGKLTEYLKELKFLKRLEKMDNHYVICGGGRVGERVAEELHRRSIPYIVIEKDELIANKLKKRGFTVSIGDATEEAVLVDANVKKARALIAVLHDAEKNVLVTLTARELAPELVIYARADKKEHEKKLKRAGANYVLVPEVLCAEKILSELFENDASKIMHQIFKEGKPKQQCIKQKR